MSAQGVDGDLNFPHIIGVFIDRVPFARVVGDQPTTIATLKKPHRVQRHRIFIGFIQIIPDALKPIVGEIVGELTGPPVHG